MRRTIAVLFAVVAAYAAAPARHARLESLDPRFLRLVPKGLDVETLAGGQAWAEGPVWDRREGRLLFSDVPGDVVRAWSRGTGLTTFLKPSGYTGKAPFTGREPGSNGLTFDSQGRLVMCQHGDRRVVRVEADGTWTTLADRYEGHRLNSPNDLAYGPDGSLYFTDPPYGLPKTFDDPGRELGWNGVYRLGPDGHLQVLVKDLKAPNGIGLSPDGKTLYVSNSDPQHAVWMAYPVESGGGVGAGRVLYDATSLAGSAAPGLPDGLKLDRDGDLFATGPDGLFVLTPQGKLLGRIHLGEPTANLAWGEDGHSLFVTSNHDLLRLRVAATGAGF
jgi:gluconolactonase